MKKNINTRSFWNSQNIKNAELLSYSQIYIHKHNIVLKWLGKNNISLLNIGVGNGYLEKLLQLKNKKIKLFGIDISDHSIRNIKDKVGGTFKVSNITKIPFKNSLFDIVTALDILEHLNLGELNTGLKEIRRILKDNGRLIISVPLNEKYTDRKINRHLISFSKKSILNILRKNNFKIDKTKELFAFQRFYLLKSIVANLMNIKKPNLLILICRKK